MRVPIVIIGCLVGGVALLPRASGASETDELRRQLEQLRSQFEQVQQEYQRALEALTERLQRVEAQPRTATAPVVAQTPPTPAPTPSLRDYAQPRPPFSLPGRGGGGFLRFRLAYKHTARDRREPFAVNDASARIVDELFLQATFILGAHPAHPF